MVSGSGNMMLGHNSVNVACRFLIQRADKDVLEGELIKMMVVYGWLNAFLF